MAEPIHLNAAVLAAMQRAILARWPGLPHHMQTCQSHLADAWYARQLQRLEVVLLNLTATLAEQYARHATSGMPEDGFAPDIRQNPAALFALDHYQMQLDEGAHNRFQLSPEAWEKELIVRLLPEFPAALQECQVLTKADRAVLADRRIPDMRGKEVLGILWYWHRIRPEGRFAWPEWDSKAQRFYAYLPRTPMFAAYRQVPRTRPPPVTVTLVV
jgi:hypothetical protein